MAIFAELPDDLAKRLQHLWGVLKFHLAEYDPASPMSVRYLLSIVTSFASIIRDYKESHGLQESVEEIIGLLADRDGKISLDEERTRKVYELSQGVLVLDSESKESLLRTMPALPTAMSDLLLVLNHGTERGLPTFESSMDADDYGKWVREEGVLTGLHDALVRQVQTIMRRLDVVDERLDVALDVDMTSESSDISGSELENGAFHSAASMKGKVEKARQDLQGLILGFSCAFREKSVWQLRAQSSIDLSRIHVLDDVMRDLTDAESTLGVSHIVSGSDKPDLDIASLQAERQEMLHLRAQQKPTKDCRYIEACAKRCEELSHRLDATLRLKAIWLQLQKSRSMVDEDLLAYVRLVIILRKKVDDYLVAINQTPDSDEVAAVFMRIFRELGGLGLSVEQLKKLFREADFLLDAISLTYKSDRISDAHTITYNRVFGTINILVEHEACAQGYTRDDLDSEWRLGPTHKLSELALGISDMLENNSFNVVEVKDNKKVNIVLYDLEGADPELDTLRRSNNDGEALLDRAIELQRDWVASELILFAPLLTQYLASYPKPTPKHASQHLVNRLLHEINRVGAAMFDQKVNATPRDLYKDFVRFAQGLCDGQTGEFSKIVDSLNTMPQNVCIPDEGQENNTSPAVFNCYNKFRGRVVQASLLPGKEYFSNENITRIRVIFGEKDRKGLSNEDNTDDRQYQKKAGLFTQLNNLRKIVWRTIRATVLTLWKRDWGQNFGGTVRKEKAKSHTPIPATPLRRRVRPCLEAEFDAMVGENPYPAPSSLPAQKSLRFDQDDLGECPASEPLHNEGREVSEGDHAQVPRRLDFSMM